MRYWFWVLLGFLLAGIRIVNLDQTARFTQDESSDLLRMEQVWQGKKITLIGPISNDNTKVFGSLTYYLLLPFTAATKFDPIGPVYGTAFWGTITAILFIWITKKVNQKWFGVAVVLAFIWYPLLETSRWAWNPHLTIFWIFLGICLLERAKTRIELVIGGFIWGLSIHHHFLSGVACLLGGVAVTRCLIAKRSMRMPSWIVLGLFMAVLPFFVFDWLHPPGVFVGRYILGETVPHGYFGRGFIQVLSKLPQLIFVAAYTLVRVRYIPEILVGLSLILVIIDWNQNKRRLWWWLPVLGQIGIGLGLSNYETRYFLPALPFYWLWLIQKRKRGGYWGQLLIIGLLVMGSIFTFYKQLTEADVQPPISVVREVVGQIQMINSQQRVINQNITTVASPDSDLLAMKYRDLLALKGVKLRASSEYDASENLWVISTAEENQIRDDASVPLQLFKHANLRERLPLGVGKWQLFWFSFD